MGSKNLRLAELASNVSAAGEYTEAAGVVVYNTIDSLPTLGNAAGDVAFIDSSNLLYIYSGEGWYNIGLVNQSPTITSGGAGSYILATDGTPTVITLIGSDPDGFPITWSFTTSGLDSEATVVQGTGDSSNIFTITPSTDTAKAGEFSVTFTASDGINIATDVNSFTLVFGDNSIGDVVALLQTDKDGFNTDLGNDGLETTVSGDPKPSSFSPYRGSYYSTHHDGTGDYIEIDAADTTSMDFGQADFTIEVFFYRLTTAARTEQIWQFSSGPCMLIYSNSLYYQSTPGSSIYYAVMPDPGFCKWQHYAMVRENGVLRIFVDGVFIAGGAATTNFADVGSLRLGEGNYADSLGYFHSFRVTNGSALYDMSGSPTLGDQVFTPPTGPLTTTSQGATASEVKLLTCQSNRIIDNSLNNLSITVAGDTAVSGHVPWAFDTSTTTGSVYYDGNDYVAWGDGSATAPWNPSGDGDHTWEAWIYPITTAGGGTQIFMSTTWTSPGANFYIETAGNLRWQIYTQNSDNTSNRVPAKQWSHVAWCESSGTGYLFLNGELIESKASITNAIGYSNYFYTGSRGGTSPFTGYMSNVKTHRVALYTSAFTPPTSPLTATSDTTLLTHQTYHPSDSTAIGDKSGGEMPLTVNGDINTSSFSPYSPYGYSNYFDGTGDYLTIDPGSTAMLGSGSFTIEFWFQSKDDAGGFFSPVSSQSTTFPALFLSSSTLYWQWTYGSAVSSANFSSYLDGQWHHLALVRNGTAMQIYVDGTAFGTQTVNSANYSSTTADINIGYDDAGAGRIYQGYISNFRIINGTALYTSSFTPPTVALTPTAETTLLTCQSPSFVDNSATRAVLTRNGDARVTPYAPFKGHTVTPDTHSVYFNGSNTYIAADDLPDFGTGDFTVEAWIYPLAVVSNFDAIFTLNRLNDWNSNNAGLVIGVRNVHYAGSTNVNYSTSTPIGEWSHIAYVRNGTNGKVWLNGEVVATVSDSKDYVSYAPGIGVFDRLNGTSRFYFNGHISNLRVTVGTALYTSTFTPSTTPLTTTSQSATESEVKLLACQSSTIIDNSTASSTLVATNATPTEVNPFGFTTTSNVEYNPTTHAGSMYGDGTTDYVDVPANAWNSVGTSDFCIQFWTYSKEVDSNKGQIAIGGNKISIRFDSNNRMTFWVAGNSGPTSTPNNTVYPFNWYHVCLERSGSTNTLYINGVAQATNTTTPSNDATPIIRIGGQYADNTGYTFTGWISDLSIRSKAIYKGNFVPPKQVTYGDKTKLQVPFNDAAIYDAKSQLTYEVNSFRTTNAATKFHNQSLDFTTANDYVYTEERHGTTKVYGEQLKLGTGDYTIEFWWNFASTSGRQDLLWIGSTSTRLGILWNLSAGQLTYYPATSAISATVSFSTGTWYHIAVARASGYTKMFVDGTQVGSTYTDSKDFNGTILYLGKDSGASSSYSNGYMDGLRITKGTARYTSNFTAPTGAFPK